MSCKEISLSTNYPRCSCYATQLTPSQPVRVPVSSSPHLILTPGAECSPPTLLTSPSRHILQPYTSLRLPTPVSTTIFYPHHSLADISTTLYLASLPDHPIRLQNTLHTHLVASYPLIHPPTESYITPASFQFIHNGVKFLAGADSEIACFDLERSGSGPVERRALKSGSRNGRQVGRAVDMTTMGAGMKGIVSSMNASSEGILAAGTFSRNVGIFSDEGLGECITVFSLRDLYPAQEASRSENTAGTGITSLQWSPCGRYLYVAERQSSTIQVYDIRVLGRRLGCLMGRRARTNQRIGFDVVQAYDGASSGMQTDDTREADTNHVEPIATEEEARRMEGGGHHNIWSGGTDGVVRVWTNPHLMTEDAQSPSSSLGWKAHDGTFFSLSPCLMF